MTQWTNVYDSESIDIAQHAYTLIEKDQDDSSIRNVSVSQSKYVTDQTSISGLIIALMSMEPNCNKILLCGGCQEGTGLAP